MFTYMCLYKNQDCTLLQEKKIPSYQENAY